MPRYRILSIDGGGIRGIYAGVLIQRLLAAVPDLVKRCDLLAGTSTGGILALGLARGVPIDELIRLYAERGQEVFGSAAVRHAREAGGLVGGSDNAALHAILVEVLGRSTLAGLHKRVLIPAFHLDNHGAKGRPRAWKPKFFHNFPGPDSDGAERTVDVAMRTSAAPTYLPVYQGYIDGGVVANNPSMAALAQALDAATGKQELADVRLLSIGTGHNPMVIQAETLDWGLEQWARPLVGLMTDGMMTVVDYQCTRLLGERYHRLAPILPRPIALDDVERTDDLIAYAQAVDLDPCLTWLHEVF